MEVLTAGRAPTHDITLDLSDPAGVAALTLPHGLHACVHAAAMHEVACRANPALAYVVNVAGTRALLIEGGPYGTTCARVGCMPSKLLIAAAEAAHNAAHTEAFGVHVSGEISVDGVEVMDRVKRERDRFVGFVLEGVENIPAEDKLRGYARFVSDTVLRVDDHTEVHATGVVIATGSRPSVPPPFRALGDRLVVNDDVFAWDDLPRRVAVFGPGVIVLELGQALARLGVDVRVFGVSGSLGGISDPQVRLNARKIFQREFYLDPDARVLETTRRTHRTLRLRAGRHGAPRQCGRPGPGEHLARVECARGADARPGNDAGGRFAHLHRWRRQCRCAAAARSRR
ncbi:hypothetical protein G6F31_014851 [Rhizopus arrhizus]|nr:hypothetical protein G6F31_014851 [Rhizopus arrhizus]